MTTGTGGRKDRKMMKLGEIQTLTIVKRQDFGVYLAEDETKKNPEDRVLLPIKQVPAEAQIGDEMEVFLYKDSKDRLIATTKRPKITLGQAAVLTVADVGKIGAFLDMGLERDLLLPFKQQTYRVNAGDEVLVAMYVDKSGRLAATMKVYHYLRSDSPYRAGDDVSGVVYEISDNFGAFVAVDRMYSARIPKKEFSGECRCGDMINGRVTRVLEDGRLDISIRDKAYLQIDEDAQTIMDAIEEFGGVLPFSDKADPEVIRRELHMSKNAFKRAAGRLYKEGLVDIGEHSIRKR